MKVVALVGPTASGKSDIAIELAKKHDAEILSCDSLLIYRQLQIGTAKPTADELQAVRHHGIDLVEPDEPFTAADYARYATTVIEQARKRSKNILIAGGTGFYLKALLCGVWDAPPTQPELRKQLETETSETLHLRLTQLDPAYAAKVNQNDRYRVIRGLEIIEVTKRPVSEQISLSPLQHALDAKVTLLGIRRAKPDLERRIIARTNQMFSKGLVNETKELLQKYSPTPKSLHCVGYKEVIQFLEGKLTVEECRNQIVIATRQLAKKQMTFLKTFPLPIQWFDLPTQTDELFAIANAAFLA